LDIPHSSADPFQGYITPTGLDVNRTAGHFDAKAGQVKFLAAISHLPQPQGIPMKFGWKVVWALVVVMLLAGCPKTPTALAAPAPSPAAATVSSPGLPTADLSTPDSAYVPITEPSEVWLMYAGLSGASVDDDLLSNVSPSYQGTLDPFQRHDLRAKLIPGIETQLATAKDHRYVSFVDRSGRLAPYNFDHKAFGFASALMNGDASVAHGQMAGVSLIDVLPTNAGAFQWLSVSDQAKARELQAKITAGLMPQVKVWAYVQGASEVHGITRTLFVQITKVQILDPQGQVLLEQIAQ
jgi:hypothetical protein